MARKQAGEKLVKQEQIRRFVSAPAEVAHIHSPGRAILSGIYGDDRRAVGSDGFRLAIAEFPSISERQAFASDGVDPLTDDARAAVRNGAQYPDFRQSIPAWRADGWIRLLVHRRELIRLVELARVFNVDNNLSTLFEWDDESGTLTVSGYSPARGRCASAMPARYADESGRRPSAAMQFALNARFVVDTLSGMAGEFITLAFLDDRQPVAFFDSVQTDAGAVDLLALIMPMHVPGGRAVDDAEITDDIRRKRAESDEARAVARGLCIPSADYVYGVDRPRSKDPVPRTTSLIAIMNRSARYYDGEQWKMIVTIEAPDQVRIDAYREKVRTLSYTHPIKRPAAPAPAADPAPALVCESTDPGAVVVQAADPAPALVNATARQWNKRRARLVARGRSGRAHKRPAVDPAGDPQAAAPINAPTFDSLINGLTFDDLAGLLGRKLAQAAISAVDQRMRRIGAEMQTARAWAIASIEAAGAQAAPAARDVANADFLPLVESDQAADVSADPVNAETFGPDWSEWGAFWEDAPAPALEDTQPMPAVEPDPEDDPDDDPPTGGRATDYVARLEAAGRVVGRANARIEMLDKGGRYKGRAAQRARWIRYSEMAHSARARYQVVLGRPVRMNDPDFRLAANAAYDAELSAQNDNPPAQVASDSPRPLSSVDLVFRLEADPYGRPAWYAYRAEDGIPLYMAARSVEALRARVGNNYGTITVEQPEAQTEIARPAADAPEGVGGAAGDQAANVCPEPINTPTLADPEATPIKEPMFDSAWRALAWSRVYWRLGRRAMDAFAGGNVEQFEQLMARRDRTAAESVRQRWYGNNLDRKINRAAICEFFPGVEDDADRYSDEAIHNFDWHAMKHGVRGGLFELDRAYLAWSRAEHELGIARRAGAVVGALDGIERRIYDARRWAGFWLVWRTQAQAWRDVVTYYGLLDAADEHMDRVLSWDRALEHAADKDEARAAHAELVHLVRRGLSLDQQIDYLRRHVLGMHGRPGDTIPAWSTFYTTFGSRVYAYAARKLGQTRKSTAARLRMRLPANEVERVNRMSHRKRQALLWALHNAYVELTT